ncbi:hypothetical protein WG66_006556 [Moniliophthora roreri]|nr:hypothetical protein WG66_006556 [Moniliophthora roreri]
MVRLEAEEVTGRFIMRWSKAASFRQKAVLFGLYKIISDANLYLETVNGGCKKAPETSPRSLVLFVQGLKPLHDRIDNWRITMLSLPEAKATQVSVNNDLLWKISGLHREKLGSCVSDSKLATPWVMFGVLRETLQLLNCSTQAVATVFSKKRLVSLSDRRLARCATFLTTPT